MKYEAPDLSHMTANELSGLMLACAFSRDKSDQQFAIACREELKRRKPEYEKALQQGRSLVDSGLRAVSHVEPKEQNMENEVDKAVAAVDGGVGAETPVVKPKAKAKLKAPAKKAAKKPAAKKSAKTPAAAVMAQAMGKAPAKKTKAK